MDVNKTLARLRELLGGDIESGTDFGAGYSRQHLLERAVRAEELFQALDGWLSKGGALPDGWKLDDPATMEPER